MKGLLFLLFVLIILVLGWFIGAQNSHLVEINYILAETEMRMSVLLGVTFALGALSSVVLFLLYLVKLKWKISSLERKNKQLSAAASPE